MTLNLSVYTTNIFMDIGKIFTITKELNQMGWPNESSVYIPFWEVGELGCREFEPKLSQTSDLNIDTCLFLARRSALLG